MWEEVAGLGGGGEMSQLCLTGFRAELCGLMLREGGRKENTHTHMHTRQKTRTCYDTRMDSGGAHWTQSPR